ncbi:MAG: site-specific integrase [Chitinophagaceae bacterium]|nr:site-specific integrase [Chitinophagaceae bacterium]
MNILERTNRKGDKIYFLYDYGRGPGQRPATGIFIYTKPKNGIQRQHNKEAQALLDVKKSQLTIEQQATGSVFIPTHKFKANFLDYYEQYVKDNTRKGNRHLSNSLAQFRLFIQKTIVTPVDVTENLCKRFRQYLLDKYTGETPLNYYARFKWVVKAATKEGYFQYNPTEDIVCKSNPSVRIKANLEVEDYLALIGTPCRNQEVMAAFLFCCYTGLRWVDVKKMEWADINGSLLTTRLIQAKTKQPVILTLHDIARKILDGQKQKAGIRASGKDKVFQLPTQNGANKVLAQWVKEAGIKKKITWSCARLSFSILLQDKLVDDATVAALMGHTTTEQVRKTYKRHRPKNQLESINQLPYPERLPYFLATG